MKRMIAKDKLITFLLLFMGVTLSSALKSEEENIGQEVYNQCIGCHSFLYNRTGPKHCGLFGRKAGTVESYDYSNAMRESGIIWNEVSLDQFLTSPLTVVSGTTMGFIGISDAKKRQQLIAYIRHQSQSNECMQ